MTIGDVRDRGVQMTGDDLSPEGLLPEAYINDDDLFGLMCIFMLGLQTTLEC